MITILDDQRLKAAKRSFAVRNVPISALRTIDSRARRPRPGDIVLARVMEVGRLAGVQTPGGRKSALYPDDEVIVTYGHRYAADAYEAKCPPDLGLCELAAAGGLAGRIQETNYKFADEKSPPTLLKPVGLFVGADNQPLNLEDHQAISDTVSERTIPVICVFGSGMNAGKTTSAAALIKGLTVQGMKVGAAKVTGTCSGGDLFKYQDTGAVKTIDFTDAGMATTYREDTDRIIDASARLIEELQAAGCDAAVLEIADGVFQLETGTLLRDERFTEMVDHWVFAADTAPSILTGLDIAKTLNIHIAAVTGMVTASPLAVRETSAFIDTPIFTVPELWEGHDAKSWMEGRRVPRSTLEDVFQPAPPQEVVNA